MKESYYTNMELKQLNFIQSVIDKKRTGKEEARALKISERQVWRKVKSVKKRGKIDIKHRNKFHKPAHTISNKIKNKIIELKLSDDYCDANFTHFRELLEEREHISISYTPLYKLLTEAGIKSKKKKKSVKLIVEEKEKLMTVI